MRRRIMAAGAMLFLAAVALVLHDIVDVGGNAAASVGAPLRDRLARVADRPTLVLTHHGRTTGKAYDVTIWFVVDGETIYLTTMDRGRQWVRNVQQAPQVQLQIGPERFAGTVTPVTTDQDKRREYDLLARKYWIMRVMNAIGRVTGRDPVASLDQGLGGFFRVDLS